MRVIVNLAAAVYCAWLRSPTRRMVRSIARWRTVRMLEQIDEEARALRELSDVTIPLAFASLCEQKVALVHQLAAFTDGDAPVSVPLPVPAVRCAGGWSPSRPGRVGPLFHQRTHPQ